MAFLHWDVHHTVSSVASRCGPPAPVEILSVWGTARVMRKRPKEPPWPSHWVGHTQLRTSESRYPPSDHASYSFAYLAGRLAGFHTRFFSLARFRASSLARSFCGFGTPINDKAGCVGVVAFEGKWVMCQMSARCLCVCRVTVGVQGVLGLDRVGGNGCRDVVGSSFPLADPSR